MSDKYNKILHPTYISVQTQLYTVFDNNLDKQRILQYIFIVIYVTLINLTERENVSFYYYWSAIIFFVYEF